VDVPIRPYGSPQSGVSECHWRQCHALGGPLGFGSSPSVEKSKARQAKRVSTMSWKSAPFYPHTIAYRHFLILMLTFHVMLVGVFLKARFHHCRSKYFWEEKQTVYY
jgi:hypothetical protein